MTQETLDLLWQYEQGKLRGQAVIDLFHALLITGDIWNVHNLEHPKHYLDQATEFVLNGYFDKGRAS